LLLMNRAAERADTKLGSAEIQVVFAAGPVRSANAEDILAVRALYLAHWAVAALAGLQARKIVAAPACALDRICRNREHAMPFLPYLPFDFEPRSAPAS
jgi:hypothetical protein